MVHMTNTAITPILSYASMNLDWEDHMAARAYQERYTRESIRTTAIGRQFGSFPTVLVLIRGTPEEVAWCERTAAGVMLTHELRWTHSAKGDIYWSTLDRLYGFDYGRPDVTVFNYWDKDFPVALDGLDGTTLALAKPAAREAMVLFCDWGGGRRGRLKVDAARLGLPADFTAVNAESGAELPVKDGAVDVELARHDFVLLLLKGK